MSAVNFPTSPNNGDSITSSGVTYTYRSTGTRWDVTGGVLPSQIASGSSNPAVGLVGSLFYNTATAVLHISTGSAWGVVSGSGGSSVTIQEAAPSSPSAGDLWFDPSDMTPYMYYNDGNSTQWVNFVSASGGGGGGGDITAVVAGTGLTGGATTGSATVTLADTAVTAGTYGSAAVSPEIVVDAQGRITGVTNRTISVGSSVTVQETAPSTPTVGDLWFDPSDLTPYMYYNDGNSTQWVNFVSGMTASGGAAVIVQEEGTSLATALTTLNFVGTGVTASGTGATKTITIAAPSTVATAVTSGSSNPAVGSAGALFYNTTNTTLYASTGSAWETIGGTLAHDHVHSTGGTVTIPGVEGTDSFNYNLGIDFSDATNTDGQLTYTLDSGTLPTNCTLPSAGNTTFTGTVGNTDASATYTFVIRATDTSGQFVLQNYQQVVTNNTPTTTGGTVVIGEVAPGAAYTYNLGTNFADATNTDGQLTYTLESGTLPSGCVLPSAGNSAFTGSSGSAGSFSFVIRATDTSGLYVTQAYTQVVAAYAGVIAYEPTFSSHGYTTPTSGTFAISNFASLNNFTSNGGANQTIYILMVGGGGGSQKKVLGNAASTSVWRFGGAGGGAFMLVGKAGSFEGCSYTVGGAGANGTGGNSWYGGYATASTFTIGGTTYTTNFTTSATYSIATSDLTASQCFAVGSDWGHSGAFNGTYFRWSGGGGQPYLTYTKPNTDVTVNSALTTKEGVWGDWDINTNTGGGGPYVSSVYDKNITFGGGRGAGNSTGGSSGNDWYGTSLFSGNGAHPIGTNNPQSPGGGGTSPASLTNSDVANSFYGAPGSMRVYWENN